MEKTKQANNRILNKLTTTKGKFYRTPEMLGNQIQVDVREKKLQDAELRAKLTA